jgi:hypothetical protein
VRGGTKEQDLNPLDGDAEGDDEESRDDSDEDGKEEKKALFAAGCEFLYIDRAEAEAVEGARA